MNKYDPLMYILLNRMLIKFGMRVLEDERIVFVYKIRNYTGESTQMSMHVVTLSKDIEKAFNFLGLDYKEYMNTEFKTIFDFTNYLLENCMYLTLDILVPLEQELRSSTKDLTDTQKELDKLIRTIKVSHVDLPVFDYLPLENYLNLRESVVRNFFESEDVTTQFVNIKLRHQQKQLLVGKYTRENVVRWLAPLKYKPVLTDLFMRSFENYITKNSPEQFPRFVVDITIEELKKEVVAFYYTLFSNTEVYNNYLKSSPEAKDDKK